MRRLGRGENLRCKMNPRQGTEGFIESGVIDKHASGIISTSKSVAKRAEAMRRRVQFNRTSGGGFDHWDLGGDALSGVKPEQSGGAEGAMFKQPEAIGIGHAFVLG